MLPLGLIVGVAVGYAVAVLMRTRVDLKASRTGVATFRKKFWHDLGMLTVFAFIGLAVLGVWALGQS